jgi:phosphotransferase system  glucose/maltose/N-acetylglucosamine-specific IIC component
LWLFAAVVAGCSGIVMDLVIVSVTAADMGGFVSETINGHPSNPWLDSLPAYPIVFVAGFVPAFLWFAGYASFRRRHGIQLLIPAAQPENQT